MAWAPLLLALLAHSSGSGVRAGLTQEASLSGSLGQKVTLTCTGNSNNVGSYGVGWYQQVTGSAPKTVMLGTSRPSGIPDRFSGSKSGNTASLVITGRQPEDEADYYCSTWDYGISNHTLLHTHGELRQKPACSP
ncbi:Ig lambda chain V-I region BL2 [Myotis davidii]|uniref:Ig lambda chain V-I region BL2 n=1 Tax=Myotis davidii TaxID=225400 RepID=L5MAA2_MYODS|nr:Ig lambda chain V-I region BL2 [Myotis davidii]